MKESEAVFGVSGEGLCYGFAVLPWYTVEGCACVPVHTFTRVHVCVCMCAHACVHVCVHMCVCMHAHVCVRA